MKSQIAKNQIARILSTAREKSGLGVRELARAAGLSHSVVSTLEAGTGTLGPMTLQKLIAVLPFTAGEREKLFKAAAATSVRMQTSPGFAKASTDFDSLCIAMIRCHGHRVGVGPSDFYQGFGPKSGLCLKGYDLLIRMFVDDATEACWLGFGFAPDETWLALTQLDDYKTLPNPRADDFEAKGGLRFSLAP